MDYIEKIKEACKNHIVPDIVWIQELESFVEGLEIRKALNDESVLRYSQSDKGRATRRKAQKAYYHREKAKRDALVPDVPVALQV
jgi:hypothetical protein